MGLSADVEIGRVIGTIGRFGGELLERRPVVVFLRQECSWCGDDLGPSHDLKELAAQAALVQLHPHVNHGMCKTCEAEWPKPAA